MDKWEVITDVNKITPGIYQEMFIVIAGDQQEADAMLASTKDIHPEIEQCVVPEAIKKIYPNAFGFWINMTDRYVKARDIKNGFIRKLLV